ncbi:MAG: hypothetical protein ACK4K2_08840 [Dehalococcoidia bacterium]
MRDLSLPRMSGWCAVVGSALILITLPLLIVLRPDGLPGVHAPLTETMQSLRREATPFWIGEHLVLGAFFLLLGLALWGATEPLREWNRLLGWLALLTGGGALLGAALASLWHAVVDPVFAHLFATQEATAQRYLQDLAAQVEKGHRILHFMGYLSIVWAFLFTVGNLARRQAGVWWGWLGWAVVVAIVAFPPAALAWSLPAGPILLGKGLSFSAETGPVRRRARARIHP